MVEPTLNRLLVRAAGRIYGSLVIAKRDAIPTLPVTSWQELQSVHERLALAIRREWTRAAEQLRFDVEYAAHQLIRRLEECSHSRRDLPESTLPASPHELYRELVSLYEEFAEVRIDLQAQSITVTTDSIVLEHLNFGPFEIVLHWDQIHDGMSYEVIALDRNPSSIDSDVTHPHVRDDHLCEGDGRLAIRRALTQGRLCDFFVLVQQILETYNADSAYVQIENWHGATCRDCGNTTSDDDSTCCERCDASICCDCSTSCLDCGTSCCSECRSTCPDCELDYCRVCLKTCPACGQDVCPKCLNGGRCQDCQRKETNSDDQECQNSDSESGATATHENNKTQLQSVCLGQALVPP